MLTGENEGLHELMEEVHEVLAFTLLFLVVLHVAGALKHRYIDMGNGLDVMKRMFGEIIENRIIGGRPRFLPIPNPGHC